MNLIFKRGDSFTLPIQFYDTDNEIGLRLTTDMQITAQIITASKVTIAAPKVTIFEDQIISPGMILLEVLATETSQWPEGSAIMDIRLQIGEVVKHSQNIQFRIERSITV